MTAGPVPASGFPGSRAPAPEGELVRCTGVSRRHGDPASGVLAVAEVNCAVRAGMRVALTGPSGSGKSTLLHLIAGLDRPTGGSIIWPGLDGPPAGRPDTVGVVFQGASLLPDLDVTENVALALLFGGVPAEQAAARAGAALARLGISELAAKLPEELSGGQAQRVTIARVLAGRPQLILADEPTGQLDRYTGAQVISVLLEAADELDAALLVATHDLSVAERLTERWPMRDGHLQTATDTTTTVTTDGGTR